MASDKKRLTDSALKMGWECEMASAGHLKFRKNGHMVVTASTGGGGRGYRNAIATMKRYDRADEQELSRTTSTINGAAKKENGSNG